MLYNPLTILSTFLNTYFLEFGEYTCCVPFIFNGIINYQCIANPPWCATSVTGQGTHYTWAYCDENCKTTTTTTIMTTTTTTVSGGNILNFSQLISKF